VGLHESPAPSFQRFLTAEWLVTLESILIFAINQFVR